MSKEFQGFPPGLVPYLMELAAHNDRDWFKANEKRYESHVREPARAFIRAIGEPLKGFSNHLVADDRKVGGSLMRVHRDTRFSKDKTPYKTNVGIQFRHTVGKDVHAPGVYLHIEAQELFLGVGLWQPPPEELEKLRQAVAEKWDRWSGIITALSAAGFTQLGDALKRVPRGYDAGHPGAEEIRRRSFIASTGLTFDELEAPELVEGIVAKLMPSRDYMAFLCEALSLPF